MNIILIVEGDGDRAAVPALVRRILYDRSIFDVTISPRPIKAGDTKKLSRDGEIERYVQYACRHEADAVLIVVDCDDGCPVEIAADYSRRIQPIAGRFVKKVAVALLKSEFETLFLYSCVELAGRFPRLPWDLGEYNPNENFEEIRGAKEKLREFLKRSYKETLDQPRFAASVNLNRLRETSKSYRHLERAVLWLINNTNNGYTYPQG